MKKIQKRFLIIIILIITFSILMIDTLKLQASTDGNIEFEARLKEFSEEFKKYLELSEEEKEGIYPPRAYDIEESSFVPNNQLKVMRTIGATYSKKYSLRDDIPENIVIKNQENTNMCWTFAALSSLETNLALSDRYNNRAKKVYDFSERHMEYATVRELGGEINIYGFNRRIDSGALSVYKQDISYLTNGMGAIEEKEMPFSTDMSMQNLSYIQDKKVVTQVYDIVEFPTVKTDELMEKMKNHIKNNGSINVNIFGASVNQEYVVKDDKKYYCYNNATGAIYCDNSKIFPTNHAVSLIGWDDEYAISNFNANNRPSKPGAWIVRNSWGTDGPKLSYENMKIGMYNYYIDAKTRTELEQILENRNLNWTSPNSVTNDQVDKFAPAIGFFKDSNGQFYYKVGDNGLMYISYYDCNVYSYMTGIEKAENKVTYDNLYQYDELGYTALIKMQNPNNLKGWIGNIFEKKTDGTEYLTQVSIYAPEKYTCKVWVNPNGSSKERKNLVQAKLKDGESETFETGYHTIELAEPIEIKSDEFFVALQIETYTNDGTFGFAEEGLWKGSFENNRWNCVKKETGKTFMNLEGEARYFDQGWRDISTIEAHFEDDEKAFVEGGDSTLKAFTTNTIKDDTLKEIKVTKEPDKLEYWEGEDFDKTGMVVTGYLNNGETLEIKDYVISDGEKLSANQKKVTIKYETKSTEQSITVVKNTVEKLVIKTPPQKTTYKAGEDFDSSGMKVEATFKDGTVTEVTDYEIPDAKDLKNGQRSVNIVYKEKDVPQPITVNPNAVVKIEITTPPNKVEYVEGQDFNKEGMVVTVTYEDGMVKNVTSYTMENATKLNKEQNAILIKFEDKSIEQQITVNEKRAIGISIKNAPSKTTYIQYEEKFDIGGGAIIVQYNDGSSEEVAMTTSGVSFEGFDNSELGKRTITVKYLDFETTFEIEIVEKDKKLPENSDFSKSKAKNKLMKAYYYTNNTNKEYALIDVEISDITKATINDSLSYSYYLSSNQQENTIPDEKWIELKNVQINNGKLVFTINTKDLSNYDEVTKANNLYIYIKETATRNNQTKTLITDAKDISKPEQLEEYIDGIKKGSSGGGSTSGDPSTAPGNYPYTGKAIIIFAGLILLTLGTFGYIRYKNIDK